MRVVRSEKCWIWIEEKDAGDLLRSEFFELVENITSLHAFERNIRKSNPKIVTEREIWKTFKSDQKGHSQRERIINHHWKVLQF